MKKSLIEGKAGRHMDIRWWFFLALKGELRSSSLAWTRDQNKRGLYHLDA